MKRAELVFVPGPGMGHVVSMVEMAKLIVGHDNRLSVTVLIMKLTSDSNVKNYTQKLSASSNNSNRLRFIELHGEELTDSNPDPRVVLDFIRSQKSHIKDAVSSLTQSNSNNLESPQLACLVLDMFCACLTDVAMELGVPSYLYFTSSAALFGFCLYVQQLHDEQDVDPTEYKDSDLELAIPGLVNPVPARVFPSFVLGKDTVAYFLECARNYRKSKGVMVNTFLELESSMVHSLSDGKTPPIYTVGPILNLEGDGSDGSKKFMGIERWLDQQPPSSVVFLCFGSAGTFGSDQVKEIARALEHSGRRFLWSLRKPSPEGKADAPVDYVDPQDVLPEGFLDRTAEIGKVIGWARQVTILAHPAIGGFVSHCGWNSILESIWFGVPIATWPMYAEQQLNAFYAVIELGLAVEIKMDYRIDLAHNSDAAMVSAREIEGAVTCLMENDSEKRQKVKEMSAKSRRALMIGGSSYSSLDRLIGDLMEHMI